MTAQFPDFVVVPGRGEFRLAGVQGAGLFDPQAFGLTPVSGCSACWRGFVCHYAVEDDQLVLDALWINLSGPGPTLNGVDRLAAPASRAKPKGEPPWYTRDFNNIYEGLHLALPFTGGLLVGDDLIAEVTVNMGFTPGWKYRTVLELRFDGGKLVKVRDVSERMAELRGEMIGRGLRPRPDATPDEVRAWISRRFSLDYEL